MKKKDTRLAQVLKKGRTVIVPMDHGVSDGPIPGLEDMREPIAKARRGKANAIVVHKGIYAAHKREIGPMGSLVHISGSTALGGALLRKVLVASPEEVLRLGATGVSIHVNLGNEHEGEMLRDLGWVSGECARLGLPLLAMVYVRNMVDGKIVTRTDAASVAHAARVAYELGADIVKVPYTGDAESFKEVVRGCHIPVVIAGGAKGNEEVFLGSIRDMIAAGGAGVSVGRNVFQSERMEEMLGKVAGIVHLRK